MVKVLDLQSVVKPRFVFGCPYSVLNIASPLSGSMRHGFIHIIRKMGALGSCPHFQFYRFVGRASKGGKCEGREGSRF